MRYYKEIKNGTIYSYGMTTGELPDGLTEITENEYITIDNATKAADEARRQAEEQARQQAEEEARQAEIARQNTINSYVEQINAGTITYDEIPEEYRTEVYYIINPIPTIEERVTVLENTVTLATDYETLLHEVANA